MCRLHSILISISISHRNWSQRALLSCFCFRFLLFFFSFCTSFLFNNNHPCQSYFQLRTRSWTRGLSGRRLSGIRERSSSSGCHRALYKPRARHEEGPLRHFRRSLSSALASYKLPSKLLGRWQLRQLTAACPRLPWAREDASAL